MQKEKKDINRKIIIGLGGFFCIMVFLVFMWRFHMYQKAEEEYQGLIKRAEPSRLWIVPLQQEESLESPFSPNPKLDGLRELNSDVIGWIEIPDTNVDYPVMQTKDNQYYMDHTFYRTENPAGSIYMEAENQQDFSDLVTFVYGHRMRDNSMFGTLKYYEDREYWQEHPQIYISTYEKELVYDIFSVHRAEISEDTYTLFFTAGDAYEAHLQREKERSWYDTGIEVSREDKVLVLVTCTAEQKNERIVVLGRCKGE